MRKVWFTIRPNPTHVDVVFQVKEVIGLDLSAEVLHLNAVLDIEWTDPRLDWSGMNKKTLESYHDFDLRIL